MGIGARLKQARSSKGYTQNSLADAIGVSRGVITNIEHEKSEPQMLVIRGICYELGINSSWLLQGEGPMESEKDAERSAQLLAEIYHLSTLLSKEEQDYVLDMIKTFQKHKENLCSNSNPDSKYFFSFSCIDGDRGALILSSKVPDSPVPFLVMCYECFPSLIADCHVVSPFCTAHIFLKACREQAFFLLSRVVCNWCLNQ